MGESGVILRKNPLGGCNIIICSTYPNEIVEDILEFSFLANAYRIRSMDDALRYASDCTFT